MWNQSIHCNILSNIQTFSNSSYCGSVKEWSQDDLVQWSIFFFISFWWWRPSEGCWRRVCEHEFNYINYLVSVVCPSRCKGLTGCHWLSSLCVLHSGIVVMRQSSPALRKINDLLRSNDHCMGWRSTNGWLPQIGSTAACDPAHS